MTNQEILNKLAEVKKGKYISLKKKKDLGENILGEKITKISDLVIRLGVDYANMAINKDRTTPIQNLKWGQWVEGLEGLVIEHKGNYYLRVASAYSNTNKSTYYLNDQQITKEEVVQMLGEKKVQSSNPDVYNIKFENILALGGE